LSTIVINIYFILKLNKSNMRNSKGRWGLFMALILMVSMVASVSMAQFKLPIGAGMGLRMNSDKSYTINTVSMNISPQVQVGDIFTLIGETVVYASSDTTDEGYSGMKVDGVISRLSWDETISLNVHGLIGFHGQKLVGAGGSYRKGEYGLNLDVSKELRDNALIATLSVSYFIL